MPAFRRRDWTCNLALSPRKQFLNGLLERNQEIRAARGDSDESDEEDAGTEIRPTTTEGWPASAIVTCAGLAIALLFVVVAGLARQPEPLYSGLFVGEYRGVMLDEYVERRVGSKTPWTRYLGLDDREVPRRIVGYDSDGRQVTEVVDDDRDAFIDVQRTFDPNTGRTVAEYFDENRDNIFERRVDYYANGSTATWLDEDGDLHFEKRVVRSNSGRVLFSEVDRFQDGFERQDAEND